MSNFVQDCPRCGRRLRIVNSSAYRRFACPHCGGSFCAGQHQPPSGPTDDWRPALVRRADELLAQLAAQAQPAGAA